MDTILYVGIDYHADQLQVCTMNEDGGILVNRRCANDWRAVVNATRTTGASVRAAIEVGNGADGLADELVLHAGWSVHLGHSGYIRRMRQQEDKTDFSDARLLADLMRVGYLPRVWRAPEAIRELRRLVHYRQAMANQRRAIKQRIGGLLRNARAGRAPANRWTLRWLDWLRHEVPLSEQSRWIIELELDALAQVQTRIQTIERRLDMLTRQDPLVARLRALPCVGLITAVTLRAAIGRFDRFNSSKQLSRFCGLSPRNVSSGQRQTQAGLVDACDRHLRSIIVETAHRLMRFNAHWAAMAHRLREAGKPPCVIATAVANRWMRRLYHEMKPLGLGLAG